VELLVSVVIILIVMGLGIYLVQNFLPIDPTIKMIICAVIVLFAIVALLDVSGLVALSGDLD